MVPASMQCRLTLFKYTSCQMKRRWPVLWHRRIACHHNHLAGETLVRVKATLVRVSSPSLVAEQVEAERTKRFRRAQQLGNARAGSSSSGSVARQAWLFAGYALADHTRNALILSVFAFKVCAPHIRTPG